MGTWWVSLPLYVRDSYPEHQEITMGVNITNPEMVDTLEADSRGRITLGKDYANQEIRIAVLEPTEDGPNDS